MNIFLKAKHWPLFLLFFAIPIILQMVFMMFGFIEILKTAEPDPSDLFSYFKSISLVLIPFYGILYAWYWSIAIGLQSKLPANMNMKPGRFKIFFILYFIAILTYSFIIFNEINFTRETIIPFDLSTILSLVPLYLLSMASMIYCLYFMAKTLKSVELRREARFTEYLPELLLLWIYPVGVWFIQPKVNKWVQDPDTPNFPDLPGHSVPPDFPTIPKV